MIYDEYFELSAKFTEMLKIIEIIIHAKVVVDKNIFPKREKILKLINKLII